MSETLKIIASNVAKLRALLGEARKDLQRIQALLSALSEAFDVFWDDVESIADDNTSWREVLFLIGSGRALSVAAQAEEVLSNESPTASAGSRSWMSSGTEYSRWLAGGIVPLCKSDHERSAAQLCGKALSLGHNDAVVEVIIDELALKGSISGMQSLLTTLSASEQKRFLLSTINLITKRYLPEANRRRFEENPALDKTISSAAALLKCIISPSTTLADDLIGWMILTPCSNHVARAALAALPLPAMNNLLRKSWAQFGDKLRIKHASTLQQEHTAQLLLMAAGYVHRRDPNLILSQARSTVHSDAVSGRLGSSSPRVRFLGMIVGMAVSQLLDKTENRMKFDGPELDSPDARWYLNLGHVEDTAGSVTDLESVSERKKVITTISVKQKAITTPKPKIIEVGEDEDEEEGFVTYGKPDSDPEDEDEDPTLVQRNKPKASIYIRDLIAGLQDTENYDRHALALSSAASLIRRKAQFGAEVKDRSTELASILTGLGDPFSMENWHALRQDAMVATVTVDPKEMGVWYINAFFTGDYSLSQRASILVALGLGARELAGLQKEDQIQAAFPSKRLPDRLHNLYAETTEVDALARKLEQTMLRPVQTNPRKKVTRNQLAGIVAESFFFPLTGYWQSLSYSSQAKKYFQDPVLLPLFLKTLAIITAAAGPSTVALPQMTSEFWQLLLSLRSQALSDSAIMEAELFAFLTIFNVNEDRRQLAVDFSSELLETQEWVGMVYEKLSTADEESERCKVLAAGVLVAIKEVVDTYQRLMVGNLALM